MKVRIYVLTFFMFLLVSCSGEIREVKVERVEYDLHYNVMEYRPMAGGLLGYDWTAIGGEDTSGVGKNPEYVNACNDTFSRPEYPQLWDRYCHITYAVYYFVVDDQLLLVSEHMFNSYDGSRFYKVIYQDQLPVGVVEDIE